MHARVKIIGDLDRREKVAYREKVRQSMMQHDFD